MQTLSCKDRELILIRRCTGLTTAESEAERARQHEALQQSLAGLDLPEPERFMRANLRADGVRTPDPV